MKNNSFLAHISRNGVLAIIVLLLFSIVFLVLEVYNGRFWQSDFTVYYKAASRLLSGENLYGITEDGHYVFKYSPFSATLFIPFTLTSLAIAKYIYWFFLTGIIIINFFLSVKLSKSVVDKNSYHLSGIVLLGSLIMVVHFQRELHLGQVNQILLYLFLSITYFFNRNRPVLVGLLLSISILLKPFGLIFIPYLIVKQKYKELISTIISLIILLLLPVVFYGWEMFVQQNLLWYNELVIELGNKQDLMQQANHTIFSVIARYSTIGELLITPMSTGIFQIVILLLLGFGVLGSILIGKNNSNNHIAEMALLISLIPLLSFTSHNAFGFVELTVIIILMIFRKLNLGIKTIAIVGMVFVGFNYYDIWGANYSALINNISLVSIGTMMLIIVLSISRINKVL